MGYREASADEKKFFCETMLKIKSETHLETEIDKKNKRLIKRSSLVGESNIGGLGENLNTFLNPATTFTKCLLENTLPT